MHKRALTVLVVLGALAAAGAARADGFQTTTPDACAVLKRSRVAAVLGAHTVSHPERFPLPELPRGDSDLNHFLDVSETGCTWLDPVAAAGGGLTAVNVHVYERNPDYSGGGKPWTPEYERLVLASISSKGYYTLVDNDKFARTARAPWLGGEDVMLVLDRATRGRKKVILGVDDGRDVWIAVSVTAAGRSAIDIAVAVTRQLLGG